MVRVRVPDLGRNRRHTNGYADTYSDTAKPTADFASHSNGHSDTAKPTAEFASHSNCNGHSNTYRRPAHSERSGYGCSYH